MLTPEAAEQGDPEVAVAVTSSARTGWGWWRWWWAPCAMQSTMVCCGKRHQGMRRSEASSSDESKRRSDRRDRKSCIMRRRGTADHASAHKNPLHSTTMETDVVVLAEVLVDEHLQKNEAKPDDPLGRAGSSDCISTSSTVLPSARCGGCPVAGMPIPPGHCCSWCHTCPHPGPSVYLELIDGD